MTEMTRVRIEDYKAAFQAVIPGVELHHNPPFGLGASWQIRVQIPIEYATGEERATAMLTQLAEQMRHRAIRELGLEPVLEGMRAEVREFQQTNRSLAADRDRLAARVAELEAALDREDDDPDED